MVGFISSLVQTLQLAVIAEVYACDNAADRFKKGFVAAWNKVMNVDRFYV